MCEPTVGKDVRRPGYPDVYRVTRILPNQPHWGGGVWGVRTGQHESTEAAAEWTAAKVNNLSADFLSPDSLRELDLLDADAFSSFAKGMYEHP